MMLRLANDSSSTPTSPGPIRPMPIATSSCAIPARPAATSDPNSQVSRTTTSGRQSVMILLSAGSAAWASSRPKTSGSTARFASSNGSVWIRPNASPMSSGGGAPNGRCSNPAPITASAKLLGAATATVSPAAAQAFATGTSGPKCPVPPVVENSTRITPHVVTTRGTQPSCATQSNFLAAGPEWFSREKSRVPAEHQCRRMVPAVRIALVSEHASPLAAIGGVDAGGQNVHVAELAAGSVRLGHSVSVYTRLDDADLAERVTTPAGYEVVHV